MEKPVRFDRTTIIDVMRCSDAVNRSVRVSVQTYRSKESHPVDNLISMQLRALLPKN